MNIVVSRLQEMYNAERNWEEDEDDFEYDEDEYDDDEEDDFEDEN